MKKLDQDRHLFYDVMAFHHDEVIKRISTDFNYDYSSSLEIFEDTKRFLYLCGVYGGGLAPSSKIDEGWHSFILFTKDYYDFCMRFFGNIIHHYPTPPSFSKEKGSQQVQMTLLYAEIEFGSLSPNWNYTKNSQLAPEVSCSLDAPCSDNPCTSCTGTTNCQG